MTGRVTAMIIAVLLGLISAIAVQSAIYRGNAIDYKAQRDKATKQLSLAKATIADMQIRQREVAALDAKYSKELTNAKAENDVLQRRLDRGGRVLVAGNCPKQAASPSSVDNGATVELAPVAGRNILGIRTGIKSDQLKIAALQQYIREQCLN